MWHGEREYRILWRHIAGPFREQQKQTNIIHHLLYDEFLPIPMKMQIPERTDELQHVLLKELLRVFFLNPKTGNGHNEWLDESYIDDTFTEVRVTFLEGRKNAPIMTVIDTDFVLKSNQKHISVVHFMFCTTIRVHYNLMNRYKQWK